MRELQYEYHTQYINYMTFQAKEKATKDLNLIDAMRRSLGAAGLVSTYPTHLPVPTTHPLLPYPTLPSALPSLPTLPYPLSLPTPLPPSLPTPNLTPVVDR